MKRIANDEHGYSSVRYSIKMMFSSEDAITQCLSKCGDITKQIAIECTVGKYFKDKSKPILTINLTESLDVDLVKKFFYCSQDHIVKSDVFISLSTQYDSDGIDVPEYVQSTICKLNFPIVFSMTYTESD